MNMLLPVLPPPLRGMECITYITCMYSPEKKYRRDIDEGRTHLAWEFYSVSMKLFRFASAVATRGSL
jgi:hypothetical protein